MAISPACLPKQRFTDFNELSMSPLQLMDSPSVRLPGAPLTPSSYAESPIRKSPRLKQTSTPSNGMAIIDTPSLTNKAFIIANSSSVPSKAKRRLIEDEGSSKNNVMSSPLTQGNAAKRQKTTPKSAPTLGKKPPKLKKRIGQINFGVSHRIRPREKPDRPVKSSSNIITLSDLKKNRSEGQRHPFDPVNKSFTEMHDVVHDTPAEAQVSEKIQPNIENIRPVLADAVSPLIRGMQRTKLQSPTVNLIKEKAATVSPKVITKTWNQRYKKDTRERKFFKSRQSNEENRVVTVSMSENIKLQVHDKLVETSKNNIKTPMVVPSSSLYYNRPPSAARSSESEDNSKDSLLFSSIKKEPSTTTQGGYHMLCQDWDEDTADLDLSCNIQNILKELNEEEAKPREEAKPENKENGAEKESVETTPKLFPLFYKDSMKSIAKNQEAEVKKPSQKNRWMKAKLDGDSQMILDAGQKAYGATVCNECGMVYHLKDPEDELLHSKIHDSIKDTLRFPGWKKERIIRRLEGSDSYIISIHYGDSPHCWKKVNNILDEVVDKELGFSESGIRNPQSTKVYMYIADKKVAGVLVAENVSRGYRMLPDATSTNKCCSSTPHPVICGVNRIWTLGSYRRHKVATKLIDAMRSEFVYGKILTVDEVAFSYPTESGLAFAASYSKRPDFLVYNL